MGGCDKTTPGLLMGASSMDLPSIFVPAGPMLRGHWGGTTLGSGSDTWKYWADLRAGAITEDDWQEIENGIARSPGHCMTMGTASTMTSAVEALGVTLPGAASIPAADSRHAVMGAHSGRRIVEMVWDDVKLSDVCTRAAFRNAVVCVLALGGSTNAIIHLIAMARRLGVELALADFEELARVTPLLANIRPSGKYLMEDFFYAGGLPAMLNNLGDLLDTSARTVNGATLGENIARAKTFNEDVIRTVNDPIVAEQHPRGAARQPGPGRRGDQARGGRGAAAPAHRARGRLRELRRHGRPDRRAGPRHRRELGDRAAQRRAAGRARACPSGGSCRSRRRSWRRGSGTWCGSPTRACPAPATAPACCTSRRRATSAARWRWSAPATSIELDVPGRRLELKVSDEELEKRRADWQQPPAKYARGYGALYLQHITQANEGCDFDFLEAGERVPEPEIH